MEKQWERQQGEPILWFGRFDKYYRPLGTERSLLAAYNAWRKAEADKNPSTFTPEWWRKRMVEWQWQKRAEAWDAEERRKRLVIEDEEREAMYHRHAQFGLALQEVGGRKLQQLRQKPDVAEKEVSPSDARLLVKDGIEVERTARGLPKEFVEIVGMSDDDLLAWYRERYTAHGFSGSGDETAGASSPADGNE